MKLLSRVQLLATSWTAAYQGPPSMGFSRQECWSGVPLPLWTKDLLISKTKWPSQFEKVYVIARGTIIIKDFFFYKENFISIFISKEFKTYWKVERTTWIPSILYLDLTVLTFCHCGFSLSLHIYFFPLNHLKMNYRHDSLSIITLAAFLKDILLQSHNTVIIPKNIDINFLM